MRKQVVAAAQVSTGSSSVGSCSLVRSGAHLGGLFCLLAGTWDWSHTGPLADWSLQHLGGCAGDRNSVGPSSAGHSELKEGNLVLMLCQKSSHNELLERRAEGLCAVPQAFSGGQQCVSC